MSSETASGPEGPHMAEQMEETPTPTASVALPETPQLGLGWRGWAIFILYVTVVTFVASRHEPWRDEWQAWGIALSSPSWLDLLANTRYEGHPPLWHTILWLLSKLTVSGTAMTGAAIAAGSAAVLVLVRRSPFTTLQTLFIVFGAPLAFEYTVIARSYSLGVLGLFLACACWSARHTRPWALGAALCLLACSSAYGVVLVLAFLVTLVFENERTGAWAATFRHQPDLAGIGTGLVALGLAIAVFSARPPSDFVAGAGEQNYGFLSALFGSAVRVGWGLFPYPLGAAFPWGTAFLSGWLAIAVGVLGLAIFHTLALRQRPLAATFFWVSIAGLFAFTLFLHLGVIRHAMHVGLAMVAAAWLAGIEKPEPPPFLTGLGRFTLVLLLVPTWSAARIAITADIQRPFSNANALAAWATANGQDPTTWYASPDFAAISVAGVLGQPLRLLEANGEPRRFVIWNRQRWMDDAARYRPVIDARNRDGHATLLLNHALTREEEATIGGKVTLLHAERNAIVHDENFYLYDLRMDRHDRAAPGTP